MHATAIGDRARAARAWLAAAEHALARFVAADAGALASRAIAVAEDLQDEELRGRGLILRGRARDAEAEYPLAFDDYVAAHDAADAAGDRRLRMIALRELGGDVPVALGRSPSACETPLLECLGLARSLGARSTEADVLDRLTVLACSRLDFDRALSLASAAVAVGRADGQDTAIAHGLDAVKTAHAYLGLVGTVAEVTRELAPIQRRLGDLWGLQWTIFEAALVPLAAQDYAAAVRGIDSALGVCTQHGYRSHAPYVLAHLGWVHRLAGHLDTAEEVGRRAWSGSGRHRHAWWSTTAASFLGSTLIARGRAAEAAAILVEAAAAADVPGADGYLARCLGPLAAASGSAEVRTRADRSLARVRIPAGAAWLHGADAYLGVARAWAAAGRPDRVAEILLPFRGAARSAGWPDLVALADELL